MAWTARQALMLETICPLPWEVSVPGEEIHELAKKTARRGYMAISFETRRCLDCVRFCVWKRAVG